MSVILVLVRPDGHVAWRGDSMPDNPAAIIDRRGREAQGSSSRLQDQKLDCNLTLQIGIVTCSKKGFCFSSLLFFAVSPFQASREAPRKFLFRILRSAPPVCRGGSPRKHAITKNTAWTST